MNLFINLFLRNISFTISVMTVMMMLWLFLSKTCCCWCCSWGMWSIWLIWSISSTNCIFKRRCFRVPRDWFLVINTTSLIRRNTSSFDVDWCWVIESSRISNIWRCSSETRSGTVANLNNNLRSSRWGLCFTWGIGSTNSIFKSRRLSVRWFWLFFVDSRVRINTHWLFVSYDDWWRIRESLWVAKLDQRCRFVFFRCLFIFLLLFFVFWLWGFPVEWPWLQSVNSFVIIHSDRVWVMKICPASMFNISIKVIRGMLLNGLRSAKEQRDDDRRLFKHY